MPGTGTAEPSVDVEVDRRDRVTPRRRTLGDLRTPTALLGLACVALVFFAHFRPWQEGLVEEWGLALAWEQQGFAAYWSPSSLSYTMGRPLHLLTAYLALEISRGGFVGIFGAFALAAVGQLLLARWALAPTGASTLVRWLVGLAVAMHPWWIAGFTPRFLPAQVAITLCILWFGATTRFLASGRRRALAGAVLALLAALLIYQGPAFAVMLGLGCLTVVSRWRTARLVWAWVATVGTIGVSGVWALFVAPRIAPTYEQAIVDAYDISPLDAVKAVLRTTVILAPAVTLLLALTAVVVISLGFSQVITAPRAWLLLGAVAVAPLAALIFYPSTFHLNSHEHVQLTVGLAGWMVVAAVAPTLSGRRHLLVGFAAVTAVGALAAAVYGPAHWGRFAEAQQSMIEAAAPMRELVEPGERLVAEDDTGHYGSLYLLLPPYLDVALQLDLGPGPEAVLCTPASAPRQPYLGTEDCSLVLTPEAEKLGTRDTVYGPVDFYAVPID